MYFFINVNLSGIYIHLTFGKDVSDYCEKCLMNLTAAPLLEEMFILKSNSGVKLHKTRV